MLTQIIEVLESARRATVRSVNAIMTATYWEIGRRIVELEQGGESRAEYGKQVIERLAQDLTSRLGRGFKKSNLFQMRAFYLSYPDVGIPLAGLDITPDIFQTLSGKFPLPWSHYVKLLSVKSPDARSFYESESLRGGWSVRQLTRQISTQFYERTLLSRNKAAILETGSKARTEDALVPEDEIRDPFILEFLDQPSKGHLGTA
jgi:hypothetical protein